MENNILGQEILHKTFGQGEVIDFKKNIIVISFQSGEKSFVLPDAFEQYLIAKDEKFQIYVQSLLNDKKEQQKREEEQKRIEKENALMSFKTENTPLKKIERITKSKRENIAFKCNFCDGGKSNEQVGYMSACSDEMIYHNIVIEKKAWCNSTDSPCHNYYNKLITREELDSYCNNDGFVCYESQMLREWKAYAGVVQRGERKGEPMKLNKVQPNSLCVLTTRNPTMSESERYIFAVFLVDETYTGDKNEEGYVGTKSKYKIKLSPDEGKNILFWKYHKNNNSPERVAWSSGLHRYFEDEMAIQILRDIVEVKIGTKDEHIAKDFLNYFSKLNSIDTDEVESPSGALTLNN